MVGHEVRGLALLKAMGGGERVGRVAGEQHVRAVLEHRAGDGDRLPGAAHERRGAGGPV